VKALIFVFTILLIPSLCSAKKYEVLLSCDNVEAIELHKIRGALWYDAPKSADGFTSVVFFRLPAGIIPQKVEDSAEENRMGERGVWKEIRILTSSGEVLSSDTPKWDTIRRHILVGYKSKARARENAELVCKEKTPEVFTTDESLEGKEQ
jgi:hypothetical protein